MDRIERTQMKGKQLFGAPPDNRNAPDGELLDIFQRFGFGEAFWQEGLDDAMRELITVAILTVNQTLPQLEAHTAAALRVGCTPEAVVEAVYQCAPYIGFPKALCAAAAVRKALAAQGVTGTQPRGTVTEDTRRSAGLAVQKAIFGQAIDEMQRSAPPEQAFLQQALTGLCFGDFYTRGELDVRQRELLTFCILAAQGGCEPQATAHVRGNLAVGNDKQTLLAALLHGILYIGFPRTLNALACLNQVCSEA